MTTSSNSRVFLLLFLATLAAFGPFVTDFYLPTLPEQTTDFHTSPAMVQLGLSNIMWGLAAGQLLVGPISDRRGRKKPLFWCLVLFAVTTAVAAAATEIHVFLVMRFFEGLGAAGAIVLSRSIAADRYTGRELGSFMGVMGAIQGIAPITAPMLGALIADAAGWRGIFWILFGTGVVLAFITLFVFVETLPRSRINSAERSSNGTQRESIRESSAKLIADPVFCGIVFQQLLASGILFGHISSSPFIFRGHFDLSPELYGLTFGLLALGITAGAVISSRIDPLKALGVGAVGMLVCAVFVAVCFITNLSLWAVLPFYFLLMAFLGLTLPAAMTAALTLHRQRAGFAAAVIGSVGFVGGGLVAPLTAIGEVTRTASIIFVVCGVLLVLISFWLNRRMKLSLSFKHKIPTVKQPGACSTDEESQAPYCINDICQSKHSVLQQTCRQRISFK